MKNTVQKALEQIATEQHKQELRKKRIAQANFMEHKKTCKTCSDHFDMVMAQKAMQEAGEEASTLISRMSSIATQTLSKPTFH